MLTLHAWLGLFAALSPTGPQIGLNHMPCSFKSLASAVAAAGPGDTVVLEEGYAFLTRGVAIGKPLTIRTGSANCTTDWDGTGTVAVLTASGSGQIASVTADVTFQDLTLRDGSSANGGALSVTGAATATLKSVLVTGNAADNGGGIYAQLGGRIVLFGSTRIAGNTVSQSGGGVYVSGGTLDLHDDAAIDGGNNASLDGGGVYAVDTSIELDDRSVIDGNWAFGDGGGLHVTGGSLGLFGSATIGGNSSRDDGGGVWGDHVLFSMSPGTGIHANTAGGSGGGLRLSNLSVGTLTQATIDANTAGAEGGGIRSEDTQLSLTHTNFTSNHADESGGGLRMSGSIGLSTLTTVGGRVEDNSGGLEGGGLALSGTTATLRGTLVSGNSALSGGGLYIQDTSAVTTSSVWVNGNTADYGGGILILGYGGGSNLTMDGARTGGACVDGQFALMADRYCSEVRDNVANMGGGGLFVESGRATIDRTAFIENLSTLNGSAILMPSNDASPTVVTATNVLFHDNGNDRNLSVVEVDNGTIFDANQVTMADDQGFAVRYDGGTGQIFRSIIADGGGVFARYPFSLPANDSLIVAMYGSSNGPNRTFGASPGFVVTPRGPYRIQLGVSLFSVDRCTTGAPVDLDSSPRPAFVRFDRGAFEAQK